MFSFLKYFLLFWMVLIIKPAAKAQHYYFTGYHDSVNSTMNPVFAVDTIHQRYIFILNSCDSFNHHMRRDFYRVDYTGNVLSHVEMNEGIDTSYQYRKILMTSSNDYYFIGIKSDSVKSWGEMFIRNTDSNFSPRWEKIYIPDSNFVCHEINSFLLPNNTSMSVVATLVPRTTFSPVDGKIYFMLNDLNGNTLKSNFYVDSSQNPIFAYTFDYLQRTDTLSYIITYEVGGSSSKRLRLMDSNFNFVRSGPSLMAPEMTGPFSTGVHKYVHLNDDYFFISKREGYYNKFAHWIIKYKSDMTILKGIATPFLADTSDYSHLAPRYVPICSSAEAGLYSLDASHMDDFLPYNLNYLMVSRLDTGLNFYWTLAIGGDASYVGYAIFPAENGSCMIVAERRHLDSVTNFISSEVCIFKIDSTGALTGVNTLQPPVTNEFILYPNPVNDQCCIENKLQQEFDLSVWSANGQCVSHQKHIQTSSYCLSTQNYLPGQYLYLIQTKNGRKQSGFFIKR